MRISRKAEYALRAITALARKPASATCSIEDLAASERIPARFLEQILLVLKRAGLLRSRRGARGGYRLSRGPQDITVADILTAVDGEFEPVSCALAVSQGRACGCGVDGGCGLGRVFNELQLQVTEFLARTSLADVVARDAGPEAAMHFEI